MSADIISADITFSQKKRFSEHIPCCHSLHSTFAFRRKSWVGQHFVKRYLPLDVHQEITCRIPQTLLSRDFAVSKQSSNLLLTFDKSHSGFRAPSEPSAIYLFVPRPFVCFETGPPLQWKEGCNHRRLHIARATYSTYIHIIAEFRLYVYPTLFFLKPWIIETSW